MISCRTAVEAMERQFNCHVCLHDYDGRITACAGPFPLNHRNSFCEFFAKDRRTFLRCCQMEAELSRAKLQNGREPVFKRCHAGVFELAVPVFFKGSVTGALFIGPFKDVRASGAILRQTGATPCPAQALKLREALPELDASQSACLVAFAELLSARFEKSFEGGPEFAQDAPYKVRASHFIDLNFRRNLRLADLAKTLGVGEVRCCQILKAQFGYGFSRLLAERRMEHAKYLLKESMLKTESVAAECGFSEAPYFHRVFKSMTGLTPREYRRKVQRTKTPYGSLLA